MSCLQFQPSGPPFALDRRFGMCIETPQHIPHLLSQSSERLLAWPWVHWVFSEVVEEDAIDGDEPDHAPLHNLGPAVPHGLDRLGLDASLELALESELLLLSQLAEIWRPCLFRGKAIAREVEGRQCVFMAAEPPLNESQHRTEIALCRT